MDLLNIKTISVILATYNRAEILNETIESFLTLDLSGLSVNFIIVDNNSTDHTSTIINTFKSQLNITHLHERDTGKSKALNKALREGQLGDLVVFTDDDVLPDRNWLQEVAKISEQYNHYSIFGGRIYPIWPNGKRPYWLAAIKENHCIIPVYEHGDQATEIQEAPIGPNFWIRRNLLSKHTRFDERLGPAGKQFVLGEEEVFLRRFSEQGYRYLYAPSARVGHKLHPNFFNLSYIKQRTFQQGKTIPHVYGLSQTRYYLNSKVLWLLWHLGGFLKNAFWFALISFQPIRKKWIRTYFRNIEGIGFNLETIGLGIKTLMTSKANNTAKPIE